MKQTTMQDIATSLGISKNAVSLALSGKPGVSEALRKRVVDRAAELNYAASARQDSGKHLLALLPLHLSDMQPGGNSFYQQVCFHMEAYAKSRHSYLVFSSVSREELANLTPPPIMSSINFDAILPMSIMPLDYCRMLMGLGLPVIMVDNYFDELPCNSVTTANVSAAYQMTKHLIDMGHKRIEFMGKRHMTASIFDRWDGYCRAMNDAGLPVRVNAYLDDSGNDIMSFEGIARSIAGFREMPTAIVCSHDTEASMVFEILRMRGLRVPEDVSVTGFDDIQTHDIAALGLTTYRTDTRNIAHTAIDMYLDAPPSPRRVLIFGEPVIRKSVAPPRAE